MGCCEAHAMRHSRGDLNGPLCGSGPVGCSSEYSAGYSTGTLFRGGLLGVLCGTLWVRYSLGYSVVPATALAVRASRTAIDPSRQPSHTSPAHRVLSSRVLSSRVPREHQQSTMRAPHGYPTDDRKVPRRVPLRVPLRTVGVPSEALFVSLEPPRRVPVSTRGYP
jgi:hypothetical protein